MVNDIISYTVPRALTSVSSIYIAEGICADIMTGRRRVIIPLPFNRVFPKSNACA